MTASLEEQARLSEWLAGFFDGDGNVGVAVSKVSSFTHGYQAQPKARIGHSYVGGLFDAEGCAELTICRREDSANYRARPKTRVRMTDSDRLLSILENYAKEVGFTAGVYHQDGQKEGWADQFIWDVNGVDDVERFLSSIREATVVKRPEISILLDRIIPLMKRGEHRNRRGFLKLMAWRDVMNGFKGAGRGEYNLAYFEELWGMSLEMSDIPRGHPRKKSSETEES